MTASARTIAPDVQIANVVAKLGLRLHRQDRELVGPCPRCGGRDRFAVNAAKGVWNCRWCARGGDAIDLVRHIQGCGYREALDVLGADAWNRDQWLANRALGHVLPPRTVANDDRHALDYAGRIWDQAGRLGSEAAAYFERRGIAINDVPDHGGLRWHPSCPWEGGTKPCVVGRYTTAVDNKPHGIWRRPIDGAKPKALGPTAGCVIRLWPNDAVETGLVLGEGVETTLAASTRIEHRGTFLQPAWAAGSAANMQSFPVLPGIDCLTLLADNDPNGVGERAAQECAQRWIAAGEDVELLIPNKAGVDFNDLTIERVSQ
jgi:phage/plasmid primase-like uncharacterized protein